MNGECPHARDYVAYESLKTLWKGQGLILALKNGQDLARTRENISNITFINKVRELGIIWYSQGTVWILE